jgi:hypothetical protein
LDASAKGNKERQMEEDLIGQGRMEENMLEGGGGGRRKEEV